MSNTTKLIKAANNLRFHLAELLDAKDAKATDAQLEALLAKAEYEEPAYQELRTLLSENKKIKEWIAAFLTEETRKGMEFSDLPGENSTPIPPDKYKCPEPGCTHLWFRRSIAQTVPQCPQHHIELIPNT